MRRPHRLSLPLPVPPQTRKWESQYPLFTTIHRIINGHVPPSMIVDYVAASKMDIGSVEEDDEIVPRRRPAGSPSFQGAIGAVRAFVEQATANVRVA